MRKSTIDVKDGTMTLFPKEERHIDIDTMKKAVVDAGFTPREVRVALIGKLVKWKDQRAFSIVSTDKKEKKIETIYLLKEGEPFRKLRASAGLRGEKIFIAGKAAKETSDERSESTPYTIVIEKFVILSNEKK